MEKLKIIRKLGKGAQGSVFLCEVVLVHPGCMTSHCLAMQDLESGDKVVLKKVECNDEGEANKAFKEVGYVVVLVVNHSPGDGSRATVSQVHLWLQGVLYQLGQSGTCMPTCISATRQVAVVYFRC